MRGDLQIEVTEKEIALRITAGAVFRQAGIRKNFNAHAGYFAQVRLRG